MAGRSLLIHFELLDLGNQFVLGGFFCPPLPEGTERLPLPLKIFQRRQSLQQRRMAVMEHDIEGMRHKIGQIFLGQCPEGRCQSRGFWYGL